jgi:hypothetical protein
MPDDIVAAQVRAHPALATVYSDVADFNSTVRGVEPSSPPRVLTDIELDRAVTAFAEEIGEFTGATQRGDIAEAADGLVDLIYFAAGRLVEMGVPILPLHNAVQRANMGKVRGDLPKRPGWSGFDAVKPPGWTHPDHSWLLHVQPRDVERFKRIAEKRMHAQFPILLLGYARHGKDTVAEYLRDFYGYRFTSSSMWAAERVMLPAFAEIGITYASADECFADRGNHRAFWFERITAFNTPDKSALARAIYAENDLYCGMRNLEEFLATRDAIRPEPLVLWVDASGRGIPPEDESSCTVGPQCADYVISNNGTLADLRREIDRLMDHLHGVE